MQADRCGGKLFVLTLVNVVAIVSSFDCTSASTIRHHELFVEIDPARHTLIARDRITIERSPDHQPIRLALAPTLTVDRLAIREGRQAEQAVREIPFETERVASPHPIQNIIIASDDLMSGTASLVVSFHGTIEDPPKEPRHLRFVTPSETSGHIGPEGIYLSSESQWYPDLPESLSSYDLQVALPEPWTAVTQSRVASRGPCPIDRCREDGWSLTAWNHIGPTEALTLVANTFVTKTRNWNARSGQSIELATYLFEEDAHLADEYLDATARYLEEYIRLLGPYPFDTFGVVENFFASGLGMPSFTLLGSGSIKRRYIQPYALGHEIVHSWIGNSVLNHADRGNWVEGLTTYLSNYYWNEISGDASKARDQRRQFIQAYNLQVREDRDYPIAQFVLKHDERDNAIGYQKAAMVFHLLRQEVGDELFWSSIRRLIARYQGRYAEWSDLERVFTETSGRDLRWFFAQWIDRTGAPVPTVRRAVVHQIGVEARDSYRLTVDLEQTDRTFIAPIQLGVDMASGESRLISGRLPDEHPIEAEALPSRPMRVTIDPNWQLMRRVPRKDMPPVLNHYVTDIRRSVIVPSSGQTTAPGVFRELAARLEAQDAAKPETERAVISFPTGSFQLPPEGSVLILGNADSWQDIQAATAGSCGNRALFRKDGFTVGGKSFEGAGASVLVSCHRHDRPGSVVSLFYGMSVQAVQRVSRLLFFYGWNSYVVFQDGIPAVRGEWTDSGNHTEVTVEGSKVER
ncbi:putative Peptidase M [Nitrospira sp. KM1]|uniref:M1 family metallopeptidase n=1 Tax=Nitrospira sp. KM1 TaxID=1936990 RepID=UPI0013A746FA|nr:M1 family aminopeptidase [Nitrospira sp. KM1]BCA54965.1 putative Peptidase M [Nitrospira sp. KM1]